MRYRQQPPDDGKADFALVVAWVAVAIAILAVIIAIVRGSSP